MSPVPWEPRCVAHILTSCIAVPAVQDLPWGDRAPPALCPAKLSLARRSVRLPRMLEDHL